MPRGWQEATVTSRLERKGEKEAVSQGAPALASSRTGLRNAEELDPRRAGGLCQRSHRGRKGRGQIPKFSTSQAPTNPSYWPRPEELANAACRGQLPTCTQLWFQKRCELKQAQDGCDSHSQYFTWAPEFPLSQGLHREENRSIEAPPASTWRPWVWQIPPLSTGRDPKDRPAWESLSHLARLTVPRLPSRALSSVEVVGWV